jgi:hypothetical protein
MIKRTIGLFVLLGLGAGIAGAHDWKLQITGNTGFFSSKIVGFSEGFSFPFGGVRHSLMYVHTDGYVGFASNSTNDSTPTVTDLTVRSAGTDRNTGIMRIAPLWADFDLSATGYQTRIWAGPVSPTQWKVTWNNVPFVGGGTATFSLFLNNDGTFRFQYGTVTPTGTPTMIAGFSAGESAVRNTLGPVQAVNLSSAANWGNGSQAAIYEEFNSGNSVDLGGSTLDFAPVLPATGVLSLSTRQSACVELGFNFPWYGIPYSQVWVGNGQLNFQLMSTFFGTTSTPAASLMLDDVARIAPYWMDLNLGLSGITRVTYGAGATTISWENVVENGGSAANTFAATLRADGTVTFTYLSVTTPLNPRVVVIGVSGGWPVTTGTEPAVGGFVSGMTYGTGVEAAIYDIYGQASPAPFMSGTINFNAFTRVSPSLPLSALSHYRYDLPFPFPFGGVSWTQVYVNANGCLTFGSMDTDFDEDTASVAGQPTLLSQAKFLGNFPRIAVLWDDFNPKTTREGFVKIIPNGPTSVIFDYDTTDRAAMMPAGNANRFSVTLNADGTFLYNYGALITCDGLVGYSTGGHRTLGTETGTDLSAASPLHVGTETAVFELFFGVPPCSGGPIDLSAGSLIWNGSFETIFRGPPRIGTTMPIALGRAPTDGALNYGHALSFGSVPGIPIDTRVIPLNPDNLFLLSLVFVGPPVFNSFVGVLDAWGETLAPSIGFPNIPGLAGVAFFNAWVTIDPGSPSGIRFISRATSITIQP